jgi:glucan endo-1,3-alpha-glucosidase
LIHSSLPCATAAHAAYLRNLISTFANHPNQFKYSLVGAQKTFVSTFAGQQCTLGQASFADGWRTFKQQLGSSGYSIFFVPSFFVDPNQLSQFDFIDGDFHVGLQRVSLWLRG